MAEKVKPTRTKEQNEAINTLVLSRVTKAIPSKYFRLVTADGDFLRVGTDTRWSSAKSAITSLSRIIGHSATDIREVLTGIPVVEVYGNAATRSQQRVDQFIHSFIYEDFRKEAKRLIADGVITVKEFTEA